MAQIIVCILLVVTSSYKCMYMYSTYFAVALAVRTVNAAFHSAETDQLGVQQRTITIRQHYYNEGQPLLNYDSWLTGALKTTAIS